MWKCCGPATDTLDRHVEQRIELARIPDDAFGRGGAEQCQQNEPPVLAAAKTFERRIGGCLALFLEASEERRFLVTSAVLRRELLPLVGAEARVAVDPRRAVRRSCDSRGKQLVDKVVGVNRGKRQKEKAAPTQSGA